MIKCNVTINGIISRAAQMRTDRDNNQYVSFPVSVVLSNTGKLRNVEVSVSVQGSQNDCHKYQAGQRIEMQGTLTLRKRGESLYFNFMADSVNLSPAATRDKIEGDMEFRGSIGPREILILTDKKGNPYMLFSGFSTEKIGETFEFLWVRFIRFSGEKEAFLVPKAKVIIRGKAEFSIYNDRLDIGCRVTEVSEKVNEPYVGEATDVTFEKQAPEDECPAL